MRKAAVCVALLFLAMVLPSLTFTEDQETVLLARAWHSCAMDGCGQWNERRTGIQAPLAGYD